jgi:hypothetical protein
MAGSAFEGWEDRASQWAFLSMGWGTGASTWGFSNISHRFSILQRLIHVHDTPVSSVVVTERNRYHLHIAIPPQRHSARQALSITEPLVALQAVFP